MVFFHPDFEPFQRVVEAVAGSEESQDGDGDRRCGDDDEDGGWTPRQPAVLSPPVPIAKPPAAHMISTSGRIATSTAPVTPARAGVSVENERNQPGVLRCRCRVTQV